MKSLLALLTLLLLALPAGGVEIRPFSSDGCSRFPDGPPESPDLWRECCVAHDRRYWSGGSYEERLQADNELRDCVARLGYPQTAELMFVGVRMGGSPYWPTPFRWGFGWPYLRGYKPLNAEERFAVQRQEGD